MPTDANTSWKIAGIIATLVIVVTIPLAHWRHRQAASLETNAATTPASAFEGSQACRDCHRPEYDKWADSHHRWAMETASEKTVLGDFDNAAFTHFGETSRFYRRDGKYYVFTPGADGEPTEFEITHTFGWYPLQQ